MLGPEQLALLKELVEAHRQLRPGERSPFTGIRAFANPNYLLMHPGLPKGYPGAYPADLELLAGEGLLLLRHLGSGGVSFDLTPRGFARYEQEQTKEDVPVRRAEQQSRSLVANSSFVTRHSQAFEKWQQAEELLWRSDNEVQFTTVGHLCREAAQLFGTSLLAIFPVETDVDPARVKNRIRAVVSTHGPTSARVQSYLVVVVDLWGATIDLIQRQEHGTQKGNEPLRWDDARRVVTATMMAMGEVDACLRGAS